MGALLLAAAFVAIAALTSEASEECTAGPPAAPGVEVALIQQKVELRNSLVAKFTEFRHKYGRTYVEDSEEYQARFTNFKARVVAVEAHNAKTWSSWTAAVNHLADYSPAELAALRGYRHSGKKRRSSSLSFASVASSEVDVSTLPKSFSWKGTLNAMKVPMNQGGCGSCWAVSSAVALRAHAELYQQDRTFSAQQILECTPNPDECGGTGGCKGATAELAMDYVAKTGSVTADNYTYKGIDRACPSHMQPPNEHSTSNGIAFSEMSETEGGASFGMRGYRTLPENKLDALLEAVYERGPVVVSVAADGAWSMYSSGIMQACEKDAVINHAVVLVGYGKTDKHSYWHIQNSWGTFWGEDGFVRMLRHSNEEEEKYCGWDTNPKEGTACKNDADPKVWICGTCGILFDSVVPLFALSDHGFLSRHSRDFEGLFTQLDTSAHDATSISSVVTEHRPH